MDIAIRPVEVGDTDNLYDVAFYGSVIRVLVTHEPGRVAHWISTLETPNLTPDTVDRLIVGLSIEWCPSSNFRVENPAATLQLCLGPSCLIFQILHFNGDIPDELRNFLSNQQYTFVGVGISNFVERLHRDHGIRVGGRIVDLRTLAAERRQANIYRNFGLEMLSWTLLGKPFQPPTDMVWSRWDNRLLTYPQILYACIEAFVSCEIGIHLHASDN